MSAISCSLLLFLNVNSAENGSKFDHDQDEKSPSTLLQKARQLMKKKLDESIK